jgi:short-subunit dehydrogenase
MAFIAACSEDFGSYCKVVKEFFVIKNLTFLTIFVKFLRFSATQKTIMLKCFASMSAILTALGLLLILLKKKVFVPKPLFTNYKGLVVVITGASSGIGKALALHYSKLQAKVVIGARRVEQLEQVKQECLDAGASDVLSVSLDVTDDKSCEQFINAVIKKFNTIDILLLNAGIGAYGKFQEYKDLETHKQLMEVNYYGAARCVQHALPHMSNSKQPKVIAAISSLTGKFGIAERTAYCASKFALQGFMHSLRNDLKGSNVHVCIICPGYVLSSFQNNSIGSEGVERNASKYISPEKAASLTADAIQIAEPEYLMTTLGYLGVVFGGMLPYSLVDKMVNKTSKSAVKLKNH